MRNFLIFLAALCIFLSWKSHAQLRPAQAQYLQERGFLVNPGFEQGYKGWTISGCTKSLVSEVPFLNKSLKLTCVGEAFSIKQEVTSHNALAGQQGLYDLQIKSTADGVSVAHLAGGSRVAELSTPTYGLSVFRRINNIPFVVNETSNGIEIFSDALFTGEVIIDDIKLSLADDQLIREDYDDMPLGTVISFSGPTNPEGYLDADGSCHLKAGEYSGLFAAISTTYGECTISVANDGFNLPDLQTLNRFIRGAGGSLALGTYQDDATAINGLNGTHKHKNVVSGSGAGTDASTGSIPDGVSNSYFYNSYYKNAEPDGMDTSTVNALVSGDSETRPISLALKYIIKAKGRSPRKLVSQKSPAPFKAGFITWAAFSGDMEGHLVADGSCILESAYPDFIENTGADAFGDCTISTAGDGSRLPDLVTDNRFIRAAGGSLAVGDTQTHQIQNHNHSQRVYVYANNIFGGITSVTSRLDGRQSNIGTSGTVENGALDTDTSGDTGNFGSETRPNAFALTPYVRMINANEIQGDFAEIEEVKVDLDANTANELTARFNSAGALLDDNYKTNIGSAWLVCSYNAGATRYNCILNSELSLSRSPACFCNVSDSSTGHCSVANVTTTTLDVFTGTGSGPTNSNRNFEVHCSKQQIDVNKNTINKVIKDSTLEHYNLGDCKWSLLDTADFNELHTGKWARLEGQSIAGTEIDTRFGISSLPDAVSNGAFLRQNGGNSAALRVFQDDMILEHSHDYYSSDTNTGTVAPNRALNDPGNDITATHGSSGVKGVTASRIGSENRPKNISLNFYCLIGE